LLQLIVTPDGDVNDLIKRTLASADVPVRHQSSLSPVSVDMLEETDKFVSDLGRRIAATTGQPRSTAFSAPTTSLTRNAANSMTGTSAPSVKLDDIFLFVT